MSIAALSLSRSRARVFHSVRRLLPRSHLLGWADQAVVSATRLLLLVMIGRWATPAELGGYGVALSIIALLIATHESLVTRPYSIQMLDADVPKDHAFSALVLTGLLSLAAGVLTVGVLLLLQKVDQTRASKPIAIALAAALPLVVLREHARRFCFAHLRIGRALLLDCAVAGLTLVGVMALARSGNLDAANAIWATGIACGLAFCGWLYSVRTEFSWNLGQLTPTFHRSWATGKWFLSSQLAMQVQGYMAPWLALTICSASIAGVLVACTTVVAFANPLLFGYFNVLLPKFARTFRQHGIVALRREAAVDALVLAALMGMFAVGIAAYGPDIMRFLYPAEAYAGHTSVLVVLSFAAVVGGIGAPAAIALAAAERPRTVALIMTGSASLSLALIAALLPKFGLIGAAYGVLIGELVAALGRWAKFLQLMQELLAQPRQNLELAGARSAQQDELAFDASSQTDIAKKDVLARVSGALERAGVRYCLVRDYGELEGATTDIDCVIPRDIRALDLLAILEQDREFIGAEVVRASGSYFVLAIESSGSPQNFLALDFVHDSEVDGVPLYSGAEFLNNARRHNGVYLPQPNIEFGSCLTRAIAKKALHADHTQRLSQLFLQDGGGCAAEIYRHWNGSNAEILVEAARSNRWSLACAKVDKLRRDLIARSIIKSPLQVLSNRPARILNRLARLRRPDGVSLAVLGPDGAGKSTLIASLDANLQLVFPHSVCLGFAPSPLAFLRSQKRETGDPHGRPPRSYATSLLRAGYWLIYHLAERISLQIARARSSLILYDRHFLDILVDRDRYRYGGPRWLLSIVAFVAPKPDLIVLLDAPPDVLQSRKQEVPFAVTAHQRRAYLDLVGQLPNASIIDANLPPSKIVEQVVQLLLRRSRQHALCAL